MLQNTSPSRRDRLRPRPRASRQSCSVPSSSTTEIKHRTCSRYLITTGRIATPGSIVGSDLRRSQAQTPRSRPLRRQIPRNRCTTFAHAVGREPNARQYQQCPLVENIGFSGHSDRIPCRESWERYYVFSETNYWIRTCNLSVNSRRTNFIRTCWSLALIEVSQQVATKPNESFSRSLFTFRSHFAVICCN